MEWNGPQPASLAKEMVPYSNQSGTAILAGAEIDLLKRQAGTAMMTETYPIYEWVIHNVLLFEALRPTTPPAFGGNDR